jgi:hypothetical protein
VSMNSHQALDRAEALFKKKEERLREGQEAMADYEADGHAMREKTARLRALRLARDAANIRRPSYPQGSALPWVSDFTSPNGSSSSLLSPDRRARTETRYLCQ